MFCAGLGENQPQLREQVCNYLKCFGVTLDTEVNNKARCGVSGKISADDSQIPVWVVETNEELVIARDTKALVEKNA